MFAALAPLLNRINRLNPVGSVVEALGSPGTDYLQLSGQTLLASDYPALAAVSPSNLSALARASAVVDPGAYAPEYSIPASYWRRGFDTDEFIGWYYNQYSGVTTQAQAQIVWGNAATGFKVINGFPGDYGYISYTVTTAATIKRPHCSGDTVCFGGYYSNAASSYAVYLTNDAGKTLARRLTGNSGADIPEYTACSDDLQKVAYSNGGYFSYSTDGGFTWTRMTSLVGNGSSYSTAQAFSILDVYYSAADGRFYIHGYGNDLSATNYWKAFVAHTTDFVTWTVRTVYNVGNATAGQYAYLQGLLVKRGNRLGSVLTAPLGGSPIWSSDLGQTWAQGTGPYAGGYSVNFYTSYYDVRPDGKWFWYTPGITGFNAGNPCLVSFAGTPSVVVDLTGTGYNDNWGVYMTPDGVVAGCGKGVVVKSDDTVVKPWFQNTQINPYFQFYYGGALYRQRFDQPNSGMFGHKQAGNDSYLKSVIWREKRYDGNPKQYILKKNLLPAGATRPNGLEGFVAAQYPYGLTTTNGVAFSDIATGAYNTYSINSDSSWWAPYKVFFGAKNLMFCVWRNYSYTSLTTPVSTLFSWSVDGVLWDPANSSLNIGVGDVSASSTHTAYVTKTTKNVTWWNTNADTDTYPTWTNRDLSVVLTEFPVRIECLNDVWYIQGENGTIWYCADPDPSLGSWSRLSGLGAIHSFGYVGGKWLMANNSDIFISNTGTGGFTRVTFQPPGATWDIQHLITGVGYALAVGRNTAAISPNGVDWSFYDTSAIGAGDIDISRGMIMPGPNFYAFESTGRCSRITVTGPNTPTQFVLPSVKHPTNLLKYYVKAK